MAKVTGGCLCGNVQYSYDAEPVFTAVCHCTHCQKTSGGAFSVNLGIPADKVEITGSALTKYEDEGTSGKPVIRMFCNKCGSPIATDAKAFPGMLFIKAGTLEDASGVKPGLHIWTDSAQSWVTIDPDVQSVPRNPS
jgi:hypothetical protein